VQSNYFDIFEIFQNNSYVLFFEKIPPSGFLRGSKGIYPSKFSNNLGDVAKTKGILSVTQPSDPVKVRTRVVDPTTFLPRVRIRYFFMGLNPIGYVSGKSPPKSNFSGKYQVFFSPSLPWSGRYRVNVGTLPDGYLHKSPLPRITTSEYRRVPPTCRDLRLGRSRLAQQSNL
jgi:hypothetical protein